MRQYELTVIAKSDLEGKNIQTLLTKIGAKITSKTDAQKKALAYEIAKTREAFYFYFEFELEQEKIKDVDSKIKLQDNIIRYLLVTK